MCVLKCVSWFCLWIFVIKGRSHLFFGRVDRTECCIWRVLRGSACIFQELVVRCLYFEFVGGACLPVPSPLPPRVLGVSVMGVWKDHLHVQKLFLFTSWSV